MEYANVCVCVLSQLLELLLELNSTVRMPPHLRYKLNAPDDSLQEEAEGALPLDCDATTAREKLREARDELLAGETSPDECRQLEESILRNDQFAPASNLTTLLKVPHTENEQNTSEDDLASALGFLAPEHEAEYATLLDGGTGVIPRASERRSSTDRDRETVSRNPVSVFNWLKKHQPNAFHHDGESVAEKQGSRTTGSRTSKRATAAQAPREDDAYDDQGVLLDVPATGKGAGAGGGAGGGAGRGKRKRDDDGGYRPKGGSGGRKKKKEDTGTKRAKRSSAAGSTA